MSNRLSREKSPYLLQHAENPVDWYPWGEEAFKAARRDNKPVFLSIGYSTCHWCHVMAHESFESQDIADVLNKHFISIKVDREERPDIDHFYMTAVTVMTGQGGWPMSVFLTPDRHPFFGGTYFPPYPRWGTPGFAQVLESVAKAWEDQQGRVKESAASIIGMLSQRRGESSDEAGLDEKTLDQGFFQLASRYDRAHGGFGSAPKFPSPHQLMFLMRYGHRRPKEEALQMTFETLRHMAQGGIHDHLGGGFHRYATDREWQIPHFEKMLYDQALISRAYLEAYQISRETVFAETARAVFDYVLRDLTSPEGGFYSAEDADSVDPYDADSVEKKEGAYYLWTQTGIMDVLGQDDAFVFNTHYQINQDGNAHSDPHGEFEGRNIIFAVETVEQTAERTGRSLTETEEILERSRIKLLEARRKRQRPHLDDKIMTDWNGLMIASLAFGGRVLQDMDYLSAAKRAADFILSGMMSDGKLLHRFRDGEAGIEGTLDDYAYFVYGLLELYQASLDAKYLVKAKELTDRMIELFSDETHGGFFLSSKVSGDLPFRTKDVYDGACPSGNSIAAANLARLYRITLDERYNREVERLLKVFAPEAQQTPMGYAQLLMSLDMRLKPGCEIVMCSGQAGMSVDDVLNAVGGIFSPWTVVLGYDEALTAISPLMAGKHALQGRTTVFVCEGRTCRPPVTEISKIEDWLS